jgi:DNA-binding response OmpR family regulator
MKLVVVDDLNKNLKLYSEVLGSEFDLEMFNNPEEVVKSLPSIDCDLMLLDWNMPIMNGLEVLKSFREVKPKVPVIMITGEYLERNLIEALNVGAEDFVVKPISNAELIARIKNKIAKAKQQLKLDALAKPSMVTFFDDSFSIRIKDQHIQLQSKEYKVLRYIANFERKLVSREDIMRNVWDAPEINSTTLDTHLSILRKKLGDYAKIIVTKKGHGYIFDTSDFEEKEEIEEKEENVENKREDN